MAVRKVFKWCVVILLLVGVAGGLAAYWLWSRSDELLREAVLARCCEIVPEWDVNIGRARFDWHRRVHLYDVTVKAAHHEEPVVTLPEIVIHVDRERFAERQEIDVQRVRLLGPTFNLVRDKAGNWNWKDLPPPVTPRRSLPECEIDEASVWVRIESDDGNTPTRRLVHHGDLQLIPSGKRQFSAKGMLQIARAGTLRVNGQWDVDAKTWTFGGQVKDAPVGREVFEIAADTSPVLRAELAHVQTRLQHLAGFPANVDPGPGRVEASVVSRSAVSVQPPRASSRPFAIDDRPSPFLAPHSARPIDTVSDLGVSGTLDVDFQISRRNADAETEFKVRIGVKGGQVTNAALPFPLRDLKGEIYWDNNQLRVKNLTAQNGVTQLEVVPSVDQQGMTIRDRFEISVWNLALDERLRNRLPTRLQKFYDDFKPSGQIDVRCTLYRDAQGEWRPENFLLTASDSEVCYKKFPYPIHSVSGRIFQRNENLEFDFEGRAGQRLVTLKGWVKEPKPGAESAFHVRTWQLPLDDALLAACSPGTRKTLNSLNLKGSVEELFLDLYRPHGVNNRFEQHLNARLQNATLQAEHFPYRLTNLSGVVTYSSVEKKWKFLDLKATHGSAQLTGRGWFSKESEPGRLKIEEITARGAHFDGELRAALPAHLQEVWDDLSPTGRLNVIDATVTWTPGLPPVVSLPTIEVYGTGLVMRVFPYPFSSVEATLSYADRIVEVKKFSASHEDTKLTARGRGYFAPTGDWTFRIEPLTVDRLIPDRLFRRALPAGMRDAFEKLNPRGPLDLSGVLEFRGVSREDAPITAAWEIETVLTKATIDAGLELKGVNGVVTARGTWDGMHVENSGRIDLSSVTVLDHELTRVQGPYRLTDRDMVQKLIVGSEKVATFKGRSVPADERITARAVGGVLTLDGIVALAERPSYHLIATMSQGSLEKYARRYLPGVTNVRGVMNGWIDLEGRGESAGAVVGRGQLRVSPAALYELPIMVQTFNVLRFVPPDKTAFKYARVDFTVADRRFNFPLIDLVGDAISLRGKGTAGFDGALDLKFYSMLPRNQLPPIWGVKQLVDEATKAWVGVEVGGKVGAPIAKVTAVPTLDAALKRFLAAFETLPRAPMPRLAVPPLTPTQVMPLLSPAPPRMLRPR